MNESHALGPDDEPNRALRASAYPADWANPEPAPRYNLVVIGGGTAGLVSAAGAAGLGARVALIERRLLGGDCLNFGCVPSKALLRAARAVGDVRSASDFGVSVPAGASVDFGRVMQRMRRLRAAIGAHDSAQRFRSLGVDVFLGQARFLSADRVEVSGKILNFRRAIIATGSRPTVPSIPGLAEAGYLTNETVFGLTELPTRLAVVGAGPVGCELAQAFARFGSRVTLVGNRDRILPRDEPDAARLVADQIQQDGVELLLGSEATAVCCAAGDRMLRVMQHGEPREVAVDAILVAAGRSPVVDGLGLEAAGVAFDARQGVHVDDRLQTSNRRIYAAGDIASRFKFTHAADALARIALQNALFHRGLSASRLVIPWCTYTDPELAHVGLTAAEAKEQGIAIETFQRPLREVDRAILDGETHGFARIHVQAGTDRIVGATIMARRAGEMIGEVALAMTAKLGMRSLSATIHPYPTQAEVLKQLGDAYQRTRLTAGVRWLFGKWLDWTR